MWKLLRSKKLALWLIVILTIEISFLNLEILKNVVRPLFWSTAALFWLNCFSCTVDQVKKAWRIFDNQNSKLKGKEIFKLCLNEDEIKIVIQDLKRIFLAAPFRFRSIKAEQQDIIVGLNNRWGVWGMAIFHGAILIIILGGIWGSLSKIEGNIYAVESIKVRELHEEYEGINESILFKEKHAGFEMLVNRIDLKYQGKQAPKLESIWISIMEAGQEVLRSNLKPKQLINYQGYKISTDRLGFTPILQVGNGVEPSYNLLCFDVQGEPNGGQANEQKVFIKDLNQEIAFRFFPSPLDKNNVIKDFHINKPRLQLAFKDEYGKNQIKTIGLNETIYINGQAVSMIDIKPWIELIINKTPGISIVYFGFALALLGLTIYYGLPYQKIIISITRDGELTVFAYTKLTSDNFNKQVEKVIEEISKVTSIEVTKQQRKEEEIW